MMAPACQTGDALMRNGGGDDLEQNSTPVTKKLECMSQMCTPWLFSARSKRTGMHTTIIVLKAMSANHGFSTNRPIARSGADQLRSITARRGAAPSDRECEQQREPGGAKHDEDRRVERDEDVLDHVHVE